MDWNYLSGIDPISGINYASKSKYTLKSWMEVI